MFSKGVESEEPIPATSTKTFKAGHVPDGFISLDQPEIPGLHAIAQPRDEAPSVMLILNDA